MSRLFSASRHRSPIIKMQQFRRAIVPDYLRDACDILFDFGKEYHFQNGQSLADVDPFGQPHVPMISVNVSNAKDQMFELLLALLDLTQPAFDRR